MFIPDPYGTEQFLNEKTVPPIHQPMTLDLVVIKYFALIFIPKPLGERANKDLVIYYDSQVIVKKASSSSVLSFVPADASFIIAT